LIIPVLGYNHPKTKPTIWNQTGREKIEFQALDTTSVYKGVLKKRSWNNYTSLNHNILFANCHLSCKKSAII